MVRQFLKYGIKQHCELHDEIRDLWYQVKNLSYILPYRRPVSNGEVKHKVKLRQELA